VPWAAVAAAVIENQCLESNPTNKNNMKHFFHKNAILLAALLQVLPVVRNTITNPAATNCLAIVLRWGIGSTAAFGAYDTVSASSTPYFFPFQTNIVLTVGVYYTNSIVVTNTGTDPGAYFELTNSIGSDSGQIGGNSTTTVCLPPGITLQCIDKVVNHSVYAAVYGTPTTASAIARVNVDAGFSGAGDIYTNIFFTVVSGASPPTITNPPVSLTNVVGTSPTFSVTAGPSPMGYQWRFNTNTILGAATNYWLTITNVQLTNAGYYDVVITNSGGARTSAPALLTVWQPPVITNQPLGSTNLAGAGVNFNVTAGGVPGLSYQWKLNTNTVLPGATGPSFTITNIHLSQAGTYSVVINNSAGSVTSSPAILAVKTPPSPPITSSSVSAADGRFHITFNPVAGLTNAVQTNSNLATGAWSTMTNIAPPVATNAITIMDAVNATGKFYRIQINP
jgi:hypothetical protein